MVSRADKSAFSAITCSQHEYESSSSTYVFYLDHATLFGHDNTQSSLCRRRGMMGLPVGGHYSAILEKNR